MQVWREIRALVAVESCGHAVGEEKEEEESDALHVEIWNQA